MTALLLVFFLALPIFSPAQGVTLKEKLAQKQAELNAAYAEYNKFQDQLNVLAGRQNTVEVRMADIEAKITKVESQISKAREDMDAAQTQLSERLVDIYKDGFSSAPLYLEVLFASSDFTTILSRFSLLSKMADQDQDLFDQVAGYLKQREDRDADLAQKQQDQVATMQEIEALQTEMSEKFAASGDEYNRLKNQVLKLREEVRKAEEAARRAAEEEAARIAALKNQTYVRNTSGGVVASGSFVFPVQGPHSYVDSWGAARSGGRTHKGTDILASRGTPVVACVSGSISSTHPRNTGLGGITIWLRGNNGYRYYYAHLDGIASGIRNGASVRAGQVIGWVGSTGNAGSCNHLHFQMHPGGGSAANPYATLRAND